MDFASHVPGWIGIAVALAAFLYVRRYGGGIALEQLQRANHVLTGRVTELEAENARQAAELATLRVQTNVGLALAPVLEALKLHEERAGKRSERTLDVLDLIATRLGPEAEAA